VRAFGTTIRGGLGDFPFKIDLLIVYKLSPAFEVIQGRGVNLALGRQCLNDLKKFRIPGYLLSRWLLLAW